MITPDQAWSVILDQSVPLPAVTLKADEALSHFLAEPVFADRDIPPVDRSAMDGFAVRSDDLKRIPADLAVLGELPAGSDAEFKVGPGTCVRIYTGASLPPGADAVAMQEDTASADQQNSVRILKSVVGSPLVGDRSEDGHAHPGSAGGFAEARARPLRSIRILQAVPPGANIFKRGENARQGDMLLASGDQLTPAGVAVCAAVGCAIVRVHRRPVVSVLSTGTELLSDQSRLKSRDQSDNSPGRLRASARAGSAQPHQIRNSNGPFLRAALAAQSFPLAGYEAVADEPEKIAAALTRAAGRSDVIIITGGVSVGKYDLVPAAIRKSGGTIHYHGIAMKPGKPQLFASLADPGRLGQAYSGGCLVFGLPGNPLSAMTGFHEFALPALRRLAGCPGDRCRPTLTIRLARDLSVIGDRQRFVPANLTWTANGVEAAVVDVHGTADLVAGAKADGALIVPAGTPHIAAGLFVGFRPWRALP